MSSRLPWGKFYWSDWLVDSELRMVSPGARGLWIDLICLMALSSEFGVLLVGGTQPSARELARLLSIKEHESVARFLRELEAHHVLSRRPDGAIFSRKMVKRARKAEGESAAIPAEIAGDSPELPAKSGPAPAKKARKSNTLFDRSAHEKATIESESESESDSSNPSDSARSRGRAGRGTRMTDDWRPPAAALAEATEAGLNAERMILRFRDYWLGRPGAAGLKADWLATWRNWVRAEIDRMGTRGPGFRSGAPAPRNKLDWMREERQAESGHGMEITLTPEELRA